MSSPSLEAGSLFNANGLIAAVTGGGTALEVNGAAKVYIIGRRLEILEAAAKTAKNGNIIPVQGDVTSKADLMQVVHRIELESGYINLLVANAGINGPLFMGLKPNPTLIELRDFLWAPTSEQFLEPYNVNLAAVYYTIVAFLYLLDHGNKKGNVTQRSQVVAISSVGAFTRRPGTGFAYGTSKAAVTHLMKQMSTVLVPYQIRCNVLAPGIFPSDLAAPIFNPNGGPDYPTFPTNEFPIERVGKEEEMAGTILYLASQAGAYCNGGVYIVDGGRLCVVPATY